MCTMYMDSHKLIMEGVWWEVYGVFSEQNSNDFFYLFVCLFRKQPSYWYQKKFFPQYNLKLFCSELEWC